MSKTARETLVDNLTQLTLSIIQHTLQEKYKALAEQQRSLAEQLINTTDTATHRRLIVTSYKILTQLSQNLLLQEQMKQQFSEVQSTLQETLPLNFTLNLSQEIQARILSILPIYLGNDMKFQLTDQTADLVTQCVAQYGEMISSEIDSANKAQLAEHQATLQASSSDFQMAYAQLSQVDSKNISHYHDMVRQSIMFNETLPAAFPHCDSDDDYNDDRADTQSVTHEEAKTATTPDDGGKTQPLT